MISHQWILFLTMAIGLGISFYDRGRVRDEREELIQLKSYTVSHWATLSVLMAFCLWNLVQSTGAFEAYPLLWTILITSLYGEIAAKVYFRLKL